MKRNRDLRAVSLVLVLVGAGIAWAGMPAPAWGRASGSPVPAEVSAVSPGGELDDVAPVLESLPDHDSITTSAICRLRPECSTDADCDAVCGVGQGRCAHSRCPVRVCKC